jgi:hypothetical protein
MLPTKMFAEGKRRQGSTDLGLVTVARVGEYLYIDSGYVQVYTDDTHQHVVELQGMHACHRDGQARSYVTKT